MKIGLLTLSGFYMLFVVPDGLNIIKVEFSLPFSRAEKEKKGNKIDIKIEILIIMT